MLSLQGVSTNMPWLKIPFSEEARHAWVMGLVLSFGRGLQCCYREGSAGHSF